MRKIAIMGAHSAGKTSLAYILSAHFKMRNVNVKLIHESVRESCPFPINENANQGTCLWNFHKQFLNELEAQAQGYELAICDRSVMDTFVYFHAVNPRNSITESAQNQASRWFETYDVIICMEPREGVVIEEDGVRAGDRKYLQLIQKGFRDVIERYVPDMKNNILFCSSEQVFDGDKREALVGLIESRMGKFFLK